MEALKSSKQEKFARLIALDGLSISEAYKQSYSCENMKQDSIYQLSSRLSKQVKIRSRIDALKQAVTNELVTDLAWTKERFIKEAESNLIQSRDLGQMNPANTALSLIGKVTQILEDKPTNQVNIGIIETIGKLPDTVLMQLESMVPETSNIESSNNDSNAIEGTCTIVDSETD